LAERFLELSVISAFDFAQLIMNFLYLLKLKNFIAISIASLVLLSNLGIALSSHLCGGKKVETGITIGGSTFACGMAEMEEVEITSKIPNAITALPCCSDIYTLFDVEDRYNSKVKAKVSAPTVLSTFIDQVPLASYTEPFIWSDYREYGPPKIIKDFQVAFQVFRI
jgi:hypothetical protein